MKKKLIFFAYDLNIGGIETALINLLNKINYSKYEVHLILEKKQGIFLEKINKNVIVKEYKINNSKNIIYRKMYNLLKRIMWTMLNKNKYDFSCCYATYSLMGSKLAKIASKNSSIYIHSDYTNIYKDKIEFMNFFNIRGIDNFKTLFFVSNEAKDNFARVYNYLDKKCVVFNNFINENQIIKLSKEDIDIKKTHELLFVFVGRLEEKSKRITKLLNIINELKNRFSIELWIIGDGEDRSFYEQTIKKLDIQQNVKMVGMKINPYPYMKKADYIVLTSDYEGFPVIYLESILLKKKIITTMDLSDETISIKNKFGYIVSKEEKKMIKEIEQILLNDSLVVENYNFNKNNLNKMKELEKIFDGVIS